MNSDDNPNAPAEEDAYARARAARLISDPQLLLAVTAFTEVRLHQLLADPDRHDPFCAMPDPQFQKRAMDKCELLVSIDTHYSEFGWYADVILPESTYLERDNPICLQKGLKPRLAVRRKAVDPKFDTKPVWEIFKQLADRLDIGTHFPYNTIEELWAWQLAPTGFTMKDFEEKGFVSLTDKPIMYDRDKLDGQFKTPSGKIEIISKKLTDAGLPSLKEYQSPIKPPKGMFRLVYGRSAVHTHGHTINNPLLSELMPENTLWINTRAADKLGINHGDLVEVPRDERFIGFDGYQQAMDCLKPGERPGMY